MINPGLNYKRGIVVPVVSALALAAAVSGRSSTPVLTFLTLIVASGRESPSRSFSWLVKRPTRAPDALGLVYGGFWLRFAAYLIDVLTIGIPAAVLTAMNSSLIALACVVLPLYFVVL